MVNKIQITVTGAGGIKQISDIVNQIAFREHGRLVKKVRYVLSNIAQTIARSWRARVAAAPYSAVHKKAKHGPHTRSGGVPLERSIRVNKISRNTYAIRVEDIGGNAPPNSKPSAYSNYTRNRYGPTRNETPYSYKERAILLGVARLRMMLNNL